MLKAEFKSLQTFSLPSQKHTHTHTDVEILTFHCWHVWLEKTLVDFDVVKIEHCPTSKTHLQSIINPE